MPQNRHTIASCFVLQAPLPDDAPSALPGFLECSVPFTLFLTVPVNGCAALSANGDDGRDVEPVGDSGLPSSLRCRHRLIGVIVLERSRPVGVDAPMGGGDTGVPGLLACKLLAHGRWPSIPADDDDDEDISNRENLAARPSIEERSGIAVTVSFLAMATLGVSSNHRSPSGSLLAK